MTVGYWIAAAGLAVLMNRRALRRLIGRCLRGRTLLWRVRLRPGGALTAYGWRLRLYGIAPDAASPDWSAAMAGLLGERPVRLRVVAVDDDSGLAVLIRVEQRNLAMALLRTGLARTMGTGARRYRQAQAAAQIARLGLWRMAGGDRATAWRRFDRPPALVFPWWQG